MRLILTLILLLTIAQVARTELINRIFAIVGNNVITQYEVESFNPKLIKEIYSIQNEEERSSQIKKYYKNVLDFLVEQYTIEEIGKKYGVIVSDKETEDAILEILKRNNITEEQLKKALEEEGITFAQYRWQIKMDILATRLKSRIINQLVVITEEDIKRYVDENAKTLGLQDEYELRYILLNDKSKLSDVRKAIKEKGFVAAAIDFSEDKTAKSGGYLGFVSIKHLAEKIRSKFKDAKEKDIVEIEDGNIIKIFYIESFKSRYKLTKDQREKVIAALMDTRFQDVYKSWLEKNKADIFIRYLAY